MRAGYNKKNLKLSHKQLFYSTSVLSTKRILPPKGASKSVFTYENYYIWDTTVSVFVFIG